MKIWIFAIRTPVNTEALANKDTASMNAFVTRTSREKYAKKREYASPILAKMAVNAWKMILDFIVFVHEDTAFHIVKSTYVNPILV